MGERSLLSTRRTLKKELLRKEVCVENFNSKGSTWGTRLSPDPRDYGRCSSPTCFIRIRRQDESPV